VNGHRPRLAFISPVFLFPNDAGGKIRTTNILRGLKGGRFRVTLAAPATPAQQARFSAEIASVCDDFVAWQPVAARPRWARAADLLHALPVNVAADLSLPGRQAVERVCAQGETELVIFDFVHSAVLAPSALKQPAVCFTHNVEAEIFARHAQQAARGWRRWMWASQHRKMDRYEREALRRFHRVIAVSERDAHFFRQHYGLSRADPIPTGVDLEFFSWREPPGIDAQQQPTVVFTGSMDWTANVDGVQFFVQQVWPQVLATYPGARFVVVGKNPPPRLQALARQTPSLHLTGFVDDIRPHVHAAHVFVIPLLVGGGTRIKAFEAMAMGCPVASTTVGIEGLDAVAGQHFVQCDGAGPFAQAVITLLGDAEQRSRLSRHARSLVEARFGHREVARVFEELCLRTLAEHVAP
jgi:glycosyltransferase involved in cell wall biosynthesis